MKFWNRNKTVITIQVDYNLLFGRSITAGIDMDASRAKFLKMAKAAIEKRYKATVFAWGLDHGALKPVIVEANQSADVIEAMELECISILSELVGAGTWIVRKE